MISSIRHNETYKDKFVYLIKPHFRDRATGKISDEHNVEYNKTLWDVRFYNGVGKTTSRKKAQIFSEQYEYFVEIHKDDTPWPEIDEYSKTNKNVSTLNFDDEDENYSYIDETEVDFDDPVE